MGCFLSQRCALIFLAIMIARVASENSGANGTWLYPDPSTTPTFNYLDTLNASWTSDFSTPWLHLWCGVINGNSSSPVLGELYNQTAPATGSHTFPLNYALEPFSCHFELSRQAAVGLGPPFAMSGTFNVAIQSNEKPIFWTQSTGNPPTTSTASNASTNPESTASPTSSSSSSNSTAKTQTPGSNGLSQGAKIGIGVGVTLGVLALIITAAAFFWLRRRKNTTKTSATSKATETYKTPPRTQEYASSKFVRSEMPATAQVHEKDGAPVAAMQKIGELEAPRY